jgi:hypothetical protein
VRISGLAFNGNCLIVVSGKTTVARLYAKFLASVQVLPGNSFIETTGSRMANDGVPAIQKTIQKVLEDGGGTIFCDEAYQLAGQHNFQGSKVLDFLLAEMENNVGKLVFIFAGYAKEMEKFFEHNPGLTSRVPYNLLFEDYSDEDLMDMLEGLIKKKFSGRMKVDDPDGIRGLYGRTICSSDQHTLSSIYRTNCCSSTGPWAWAQRLWQCPGFAKPLRSDSRTTGTPVA